MFLRWLFNPDFYKKLYEHSREADMDLLKDAFKAVLDV